MQQPPRSALNGVGSTPDGDVWMAGFAPPAQQTLIEGWDGVSLTISPSSGRTDLNVLEAVDILPSGEAWAVGWYFSDSGPRFTETLHLVPC